MQQASPEPSILAKKHADTVNTNPCIFNTSIPKYRLITLSLQHIYFVSNVSSICLNTLRNTHTLKHKQF